MKQRILMIIVAAMGFSAQAQPYMDKDVVNAPVGDANDQFDLHLRGASGYKPMYVIMGSNEILNAKIQISFKYRFVNSGALSERTSFLNKFYIAYTQKSFWDLESDSVPFRDNNYNPELFYLNRDVFSDVFGDKVRMEIQSGYEHESNGEDELDSRSWDRLYFMPSWIFGDPEQYHFTLAPKVWAIVAEGDETTDHMEDYYGYGELNMRYGKNDSFVIDTMLRKGTQSTHGAMRMNVSYPMNRLFYKRINLYLFAQMYYGEGESLLFCDHHSTSWRFGVSLFR